MKKKLFVLLIVSFIASAIIMPSVVFAQQSWLVQIGIPDGHLIPQECVGDQASDVKNGCTLKSVFQLVINFTQVLLALTGSAALLMFTYGGVMWIIAAGNQERVQKGRAAMQAAVIGIAIILGSWLIVNFVIWALVGGTGIENVTIFQQAWYANPAE